MPLGAERRHLQGTSRARTWPRPGGGSCQAMPMMSTRRTIDSLIRTHTRPQWGQRQVSNLPTQAQANLERLVTAP